MPKIKDLGINVLPEGMRPLEIGGGAGGACGCTNVTNPCNLCTQGVTVEMQPQCFCTNATNPCLGFTRQPTLCGGCSFITNPCLGCTIAVTITACGTGCTFNSPCLCTHNMSHPPCKFGTCGLTQTPCIGGTKFPTDITDTTPVIQPGTLAAEDIVAIRQQLRAQLDALDAHEKALGDQHFDAREQELQKELEQLQARRADLKK